MGDTFGLVMRFVLKPGHEELFDNSVRELVSGVREHEPDVLVFACHAVDGRSGQRLFYELYRNHAAFEAHGDQEHTKRFLAERDRHVSDIRVEFLQLIDAAGVTSAGGGAGTERSLPG